MKTKSHLSARRTAGGPAAYRQNLSQSLYLQPMAGQSVTALQTCGQNPSPASSLLPMAGQSVTALQTRGQNLSQSSSLLPMAGQSVTALQTRGQNLSQSLSLLPMAGQSPQKKNSSIELLRFLFTSIIIFFHINLDLWDQKKTVAVVEGFRITFFKYGNIGVEFFFLLTGCLMARSIYKKRQEKGFASESFPELVRESLQFTLHKARTIMPFYLTACALTPAARLIVGKHLSLSYFIKRLPSLLFLQRIGLGRPFIGCTWYLSSMIITLPFVYILCRRFYKAYTRAVAPVLCAGLLIAIIILTGSLGDIDDWFLFTYKTNIRAFAEMSMGTAAFELSRLIQGRVRSVFTRAAITLTALVSLALSITYMCSAAGSKYGLVCFYLLFILLVAAFSGEGLLCHADIFHSPLFTWLGALSLPMYVSQTLVRMLVPHFFNKYSQWAQCFLIYAGVLLLGITLRIMINRANSRSLPKPVRSLLRRLPKPEYTPGFRRR